ncbi:SMI1/KNR4 family protein [Tsukamurella spumae]|uniref:SMI1/KNR4 family protein n=1 Tax=Tsukamurella spumae TaxID=44753 RepID=A0A846XAW1_9ACTN|nr:SMI1/KNR4 family protein [Tsukamurella spumae]NKY20790.1 SMI1/KNR4 family protein [Tsukamurella spumae]
MPFENDGLVPWTPEQVQEVEEQIGPLPQEYRDFVLAVGTGDFSPRVVPSAGIIVDGFLSPLYVANRGGGFDAWVPAEYVPVVSGSGGALAIKTGTGEVFIANYDRGVDLGLEDDPSEEIMSRFLDSWNLLVDQMGSWDSIYE